MARNLKALLPLAVEYGPSRIAFCTDDRDPEDIAENGHINGMVREAVALGIHARGRDRDGLVQPRPVAPAPRSRRGRARLPGRPAAASRPRELRARPRAQARPPGRRRARRRPCRSGCARPCGSSRSRLPTSRSRSDGATIRAIGLIEDQVVTESLEREPVVVDGYAVASAEARPRQDRRRRAAPRDRPRSGSASSPARA